MAATMDAVNAVTRPPDSQDGRHPLVKDVVRALARNICDIRIIEKTAVVILHTLTEPETAKKLVDRSSTEWKMALAV